MKKQYIVPQTLIVTPHLVCSILEPDKFGGPSLGGDEYDAKENNAAFEEEEGLINPTQPNLWDDEEE